MSERVYLFGLGAIIVIGLLVWDFRRFTRKRAEAEAMQRIADMSAPDTEAGDDA